VLPAVTTLTRRTTNVVEVCRPTTNSRFDNNMLTILHSGAVAAAAAAAAAEDDDDDDGEGVNWTRQSVSVSQR